MIRILGIDIRYEEREGSTSYTSERTKRETFADSTSAMEDFFSFLVELGVYEDIKVTKTFTTSKEVIKRMKEG